MINGFHTLSNSMKNEWMKVMNMMINIKYPAMLHALRDAFVMDDCKIFCLKHKKSTRLQIKHRFHCIMLRSSGSTFQFSNPTFGLGIATSTYKSTLGTVKWNGKVDHMHN